MLIGIRLKDLKDPKPRKRRFQARFLKVAGIQFRLESPFITRMINSSMPASIGYNPPPRCEPISANVAAILHQIQ